MSIPGFGPLPDPKDPAFWASMRRFVVKEHHASRLHWDFRLEMAGVLKSLVLPAGPSLDPAVALLADQVDDHSLKYLLREGTIPEGFYGAGELYLWDQGMYAVQDADPVAAWHQGELFLTCYGTRMVGDWRLSRVSNTGKTRWRLQKCADEYARHGHVGEKIGTPGPRPRMVVSPPAQTVLAFTEDELRQTAPDARPSRRRRRRSR